MADAISEHKKRQNDDSDDEGKPSIAPELPPPLDTHQPFSNACDKPQVADCDKTDSDDAHQQPLVEADAIDFGPVDQQPPIAEGTETLPGGEWMSTDAIVSLLDEPCWTNHTRIHTDGYEEQRLLCSKPKEKCRSNQPRTA